MLLLPRGTKEKKLKRSVLAVISSIKPHTKFKAKAYVLKKEEGGRHTPFFSNYRPQFYFRTTDVTGTTSYLKVSVMPGDNITMEVTLLSPIAMDKGLKFAIREGGRTVGAGVVLKLLNSFRGWSYQSCTHSNWSVAQLVTPVSKTNAGSSPATPAK